MPVIITDCDGSGNGGYFLEVDSPNVIYKHNGKTYHLPVGFRLKDAPSEGEAGEYQIEQAGGIRQP